MRNNINSESVGKLAKNINSNYPAFEDQDFVNDIIPNLEPLGLFERLSLITKKLYEYLPKDYPTALNIILKSAKEDRGFITLSLSNYIADYGLEYLDLSMKGLGYLTPYFSSEFAVRPFIIKYQTEVLEYFRLWVKDNNQHLRRLVSEGLRPRLPWGIRLQNFVKDPNPIIEFLEILKNDKELYVRRSVANNLNDIAKDHPDIVIRVLKTWDKNKSPETEWIIKHALRSLVKKGNIGALDILGFKENPLITINNINCNNTVKLGDKLEFSFEIKSLSNEKQKLVIDYVIYHKKANGNKTPKVFKLKNMDLPPNSIVKIEKRHVIREITTRKYYSGVHSVSIKVNGIEHKGGNFDLQV